MTDRLHFTVGSDAADSTGAAGSSNFSGSCSVAEGTVSADLFAGRLYYQDSHLFTFEARVLSCVPSAVRKDCYETVLDRTAFFPEGGGQLADTGRIGNARVIDVQEKSGVIIHYTDSVPSAARSEDCGDAASRPSAADGAPGEENRERTGAGPDASVFCMLDTEQRLRRMQNHSGEHIVSGLVHSAYGYENVGFHMSEDCMTIDFSGELTREQLMEIESKANEAVRSNLPVTAYFPDADTLKTLEYRSKLELTENVRIVEIEGIDRCACCAPHVSRTGEVGMIKILSCERHRGGVRVELVCGMDALDDYRHRQDSVAEISGMLSAKRNDVSAAVERLKAERDQLKYSCAGLEAELVALIADGYPDSTGGNIVLFRNLSEPAAREFVNRLTGKCTGMVAVFFGKTDTAEKAGSAVADPGAGTSGASVGKQIPWRYIIGSRTVDLRAKAKEINAAISGRGGGKPEMITGSSSASRAEIEAYFSQG